MKYMAKICRRRSRKGLHIPLYPLCVWKRYPEGYQEKCKDLSRGMMVKFVLQGDDFGSYWRLYSNGEEIGGRITGGCGCLRSEMTRN